MHFPRDPEMHYLLGYAGLTLDSETSPLISPEVTFYPTWIPRPSGKGVTPFDSAGLFAASDKNLHRAGEDEYSADEQAQDGTAFDEEPLSLKSWDRELRRGSLRITPRQKARLSDIARFIGLRQSGAYSASATSEPNMIEAEIKVGSRVTPLAHRKKKGKDLYKAQASKFKGFYAD
ncbi:hypothetical protein K437DRAFT_254889 [Tilletiaria anomala UBC 951]|uniref:Uncharacterized protein n=1 Tax=Tilletiaria anomala (strain ATCC 24038 / CBS 436.72 / UBC 951) TaxID=1037660 RepID=A0A066WBI2_TILAU|nr:uncharacterized protein K437DRAFT_254889 [Tilletiaria anomala UBC 951]KDN51302.1 hypothetical protein K437DRAFT_254889 [Tilletiaria anomala UBC 951]